VTAAGAPTPRLNYRQECSGTIVAGLALAAGCDSEPKPASTAKLLNKEEVHNAVQELDSQIGALEGDVEDFDSESWRDVVPRIKEGAESVRGALDNLKKALGTHPEGHRLAGSKRRSPNSCRSNGARHLVCTTSVQWSFTLPLENRG
jgi:outer membrane murein-binding lipoprotein Lpp